MRLNEPPSIGSWYKNIDTDELFEVVAMDGSGSIEIQHSAGEIESFDNEIWWSMRIMPVATPEDWSGPYEIEKEDLGDWDSPINKDVYRDPIQELSLELNDILEEY